ncbi:MAG: transcriptional regulator [Chitinophagaceae bacterium]
MNSILSEKAASAANGELKIDVVQLKKVALIFRAINHKLRQQMMRLIHAKITVTEIYVKLRLEQSVASQHLAILRKAGLVNTTRDGKFIYYSVNQDRLDQLHKVTNELNK